MEPKIVRIDDELALKIFGEIDRQIVDKLLEVLPEIQELRKIHPQKSVVVNLTKKEIQQLNFVEFKYLSLEEIILLLLLESKFLVISESNKLKIFGNYLMFFKTSGISYVAYVAGRENSTKIYGTPLNGVLTLEGKDQKNLKYMIDSIMLIHKIVSENKDWLEPLLTLESF